MSSTLSPPHFPSDFLPKKKAEAEGEAAAAVPEKLTLSFFLPYETTLDATKVQAPACSLAQSTPLDGSSGFACLLHARSLAFHKGMHQTPLC